MDYGAQKCIFLFLCAQKCDIIDARNHILGIEPNKSKISKGFFEKRSITTLSGWESIMGLQFENLVLNNQIELIKALEIPIEDVIFANPFFQRKTKNKSNARVSD